MRRYHKQLFNRDREGFLPHHLLSRQIHPPLEAEAEVYRYLGTCIPTTYNLRGHISISERE